MINIVLAGIGGYGAGYVQELLKGEGAHPYRLAGTVDPYPDNSPFVKDLAERNIPNYKSLDKFYASSHADLAIISSPIQFHCEQTCLALSHGSHVLLEKPLSASVEDACRMIRTRDQAGKLVAVGYQWCYSSGILALKRDIAAGRFGRPKRFKTLVLWPRSDLYYARGWAGKQRDGRGNLILDSVANNATAHYIHNMFYVLGRNVDESARPARVTAELYRANPIENYDTAAMSVHTEDGVELLYWGTHAVRNSVGPLFCYEFENADITYNGNEHNGLIVAKLHDGETIVYENPNLHNVKLQAVIAAVCGEGGIACGLEAALSHTRCIDAMQRSMPEIGVFPEEIVRRGAVLSNGETGNYVEGLGDQLRQCYEQGTLPAEAGFAWAKTGREIRLD